MSQRIKSGMARALVRWVGRWWTASYQAHMDGFVRMEGLFSRGASKAQQIAFPLASRLDRNAMGEQMVEEGWWG